MDREETLTAQFYELRVKKHFFVQIDFFAENIPNSLCSHLVMSTLGTYYWMVESFERADLHLSSGPAQSRSKKIATVDKIFVIFPSKTNDVNIKGDLVKRKSNNHRRCIFLLNSQLLPSHTL